MKKFDSILHPCFKLFERFEPMLCFIDFTELFIGQLVHCFALVDFFNLLVDRSIDGLIDRHMD